MSGFDVFMQILLVSHASRFCFRASWLVRETRQGNTLNRISSIDVKGKTTTKEKDIAEALNHHFTTIGPKLASKLESRSDDDSLKHINTQQNKMAFVPIDETDVLNAIKQLKNGKAPGPDKISTKLIKDAADFTWKPLTMVFNSSLKYGVFPDIWKLARVTSIFKTGSKKMKIIIDPSLSFQSF